VLRNEVDAIDGVQSVTSYLVTQIRYDSTMNLASLSAERGEAAEAGLRTNGRSAS